IFGFAVSRHIDLEGAQTIIAAIKDTPDDIALAQVKRGAVELLTPRMDQAAAEALADKLAGGHWTHDYALTATEARELGLPVKVGMPQEVLALMKLYPQPV